MNYKEILVSRSLSWVAIAISVIAIIVSFSNANEKISMGDTLTVLSILVTLLLGWNIYQVIDIKLQIQSIRDRTNNVQEETMARAYTSIMNQTSYIVEGRKDDDACYNAIANGLFACKHFHLAGKRRERDNLLSMIANYKIENCTLNHQQLNDLRMILGQLKSFDIDITPIYEWLNNYEATKQVLMEGRK